MKTNHAPSNCKIINNPLMSTITLRPDSRWLVKYFDLDAGEQLPTLHIFTIYSDALAAAKEFTNS